MTTIKPSPAQLHVLNHMRPGYRVKSAGDTETVIQRIQTAEIVSRVSDATMYAMVGHGWIKGESRWPFTYWTITDAGREARGEECEA